LAKAECAYIFQKKCYNLSMKGGEPIFIDKKSKTGILMLHGFTSTPNQFKELADFISEKGFNVSAPLISGHGTFPDNLIKTSPEDWEKSVEQAYLKLKKISPKIYIIGNSFGSNLGFWLIKRFNNEQEGIITLGAPVFLRYHKILVLRLYVYGWFKKYYGKPARIYETDYIDLNDQVTYPVIPIKSLRDFFRFIKKETIPNLGKIKTPILICHSISDKVVHPRSATYIYEHIISSSKKIYLFPSDAHTIMSGMHKEDLFQKIIGFLENNVV